MAQCNDCRHWVFCERLLLSHECSLGHSTPDLRHTEACGDFEPLPDIFDLEDSNDGPEQNILESATRCPHSKVDMNDTMAFQTLIGAASTHVRAPSLVIDGASLAEACAAIYGVLSNVVREDSEDHDGTRSNQAGVKQPFGDRRDLSQYDFLVGVQRSVFRKPECFRQHEVIHALDEASRNDSEEPVRDSARRSLQQVAVDHFITIMEMATALSLDAELLARIREPYWWRTRERLDWSGHEEYARRLLEAWDAAERAKAAHELGEHGHVTPIGLGPDWIGPLITALTTDPDISVRCVAAKALGNVASYPAWYLGYWITKVLATDQDGSMHRRVSVAFREIGYSDLAAAPGVKKVFQTHLKIRGFAVGPRTRPLPRASTFEDNHLE